MKVLQSLMTPGGLVRTPSGRHGMVKAFDTHTNTATLEFFDASPDEAFHLTTLRAGNNESERLAIGKVTTQFPKVLPVENQVEGAARALSTAPMRIGAIDDMNRVLR